MALQKYGNPSVNALIKAMEGALGGPLDGSAAINRRYAFLLLQKMAKMYPEFDPLTTAAALITRGMADDFHRQNITGMKYLYYNTHRIILAAQKRRRGIRGL